MKLGYAQVRADKKLRQVNTIVSCIVKLPTILEHSLPILHRVVKFGYWRHCRMGLRVLR